ncbi:MAG: amidohydrolase family protein, partial [Bifidobacteriaceae bacterium]|nr:amidohydrolase family protein [Bifidobacteriaceae bacterium]
MNQQPTASEAVWAVRGQAVLGVGADGLGGAVLVPDAVVIVAGDRLRYAGPAADVPTELAAAVAGARPWPGYILPGLVDIHCHGGGGQSFPDASNAEAAMVAIMEHRRHGTTSLVASLVTDSPSVLIARATMLGERCAAGELAGIHLEGPFLSPACRGAQDPSKMLAPSAELVGAVARAAGGFLATMTVAPELPGVLSWSGAGAGAGGAGAGAGAGVGGAGGGSEGRGAAGGAGDLTVVEALAAVGAVPSFGHTDCTADQLHSAVQAAVLALGRAAVDDLPVGPVGDSRGGRAGGSPRGRPGEPPRDRPGGLTGGSRSAVWPHCSRPTVTHLFNGMRPIHHRRPGPALECLAQSAAGDLVVELIADGVHL